MEKGLRLPLVSLASGTVLLVAFLVLSNCGGTRAPAKSTTAPGMPAVGQEGEKMASSEAEELKQALEKAVAEPGSWQSLRLAAECQSEQGPRSLEAHGNGVAIWKNRRQFNLAPDELARLLDLLRQAGYAGFKKQYGGSGTPDPGRPDRPPAKAVQIICRLSLELNGIGKDVVQLAKGEQSEELKKLANSVLDSCQEQGESGIGAADLGEGLGKLAGGELAPEVLSVILHRRPELTAAQSETGFLLRLTGKRASTQVFESASGFGPARVIELESDQLRALARQMAGTDPASLPGNLWAGQYTDLTIQLLQHKRSIQARQFARLRPDSLGEKQDRFDALVKALYQLHLKVLQEGSPE